MGEEKSIITYDHTMCWQVHNLYNFSRLSSIYFVASQFRRVVIISSITLGQIQAN